MARRPKLSFGSGATSEEEFGLVLQSDNEKRGERPITSKLIGDHREIELRPKRTIIFRRGSNALCSRPISNIAF